MNEMNEMNCGQARNCRVAASSGNTYSGPPSRLLPLRQQPSCFLSGVVPGRLLDQFLVALPGPVDPAVLRQRFVQGQFGGGLLLIFGGWLVGEIPPQERAGQLLDLPIYL